MHESTIILKDQRIEELEREIELIREERDLKDREVRDMKAAAKEKRNEIRKNLSQLLDDEGSMSDEDDEEEKEAYIDHLQSIFDQKPKGNNKAVKMWV